MGHDILVAGLLLGIAGDALLRAPGPPGINFSGLIALIAAAAYLLHRRSGRDLDRGRLAWMAVVVLAAAALAWRDAPPLKLLALASVTVGFALAAYRHDTSWIRSAGVTQYAAAWAAGALHAWTASALVLFEARRSLGAGIGDGEPGRRAAAVGRGLVIATPLVAVFGALFMSADAVFATLVHDTLRLDFELIASHVLLWAITGWLATGYLRGFLAGTDLTTLRGLWGGGGSLGLIAQRPALGITEVATALGAIALLFLVFVFVQIRYLFGGDALVQATAGLTYADYARRGFFELVCAAALVVPLLLAADWLLARARRSDEIVFRMLAGLQIALVLAITASALQRLRLYFDTYGLTDARFYATVLLLWIGAMLLWLAATVLRGRRESFAFGALMTGPATVALLFVVNPDAIVARTNIARLAGADAPADDSTRFDVAYATRLSADAVPVLIDALPAMPADLQCPLARHLLRRWPPEREPSLRTWNWSAAGAANAVREHGARLRAMAGTDPRC